MCYIRSYGKYFGIDRNEITLYGYSAGAGDIITLMSIKDRIRCGGISGPVKLWKHVFLLDPYLGLTAPRVTDKAFGRTKTQGEYIAEAAFCPTTDSATMLQCLKSVPSGTMDFLQFPDYWVR